MRPRLHSIPIALLLIACAPESPAGNPPGQPQNTEYRAIENAYVAVLFDQSCARRPQQASSGSLEAELSRVEAIQRAASRLGFDDALHAAELKWADFSSRAEWDCSTEDGIPALRSSIDKLAAAVASAAHR